VARSIPGPKGRILITGPSGCGKSTLCQFFRERGVNAVDGDEVRGLGGPVNLQGRPLHRITQEQWRKIEDWRFFWSRATLQRFLSRNPNVVLFGASDNMFDLDLADLFDRRIFLRAPWSVIRARLNDPARDNDWGRDSQPAQREWVRKATREWPVRAKERGFEFIDARWTPTRIFRRVCGDKGADTVKRIGIPRIRAIALALPDVTEGPPVSAARRNASFKAAGKSFLGVGRGGTTMTANLSEREAKRVVAANPDPYEEIWRDGTHCAGLRVDLAKVSDERVRALIEMSWRHAAPQALVATYDQRAGAV
jgi:adenylate kinase family enzyme